MLIQELSGAMKQYLEVISSSATGGEALSRAGIEATKRERSAANTRRQSGARIDPGGLYGYESFRL